MFRPYMAIIRFMSIKISLYIYIYIYLYSEILIDIKPDDGHVCPTHVVLIVTLKNVHLLYKVVQI